jgi:hypothetical protein
MSNRLWRGRLPQSGLNNGKRSVARIQRVCCLGIVGEMLLQDLMREVMGLVSSRHGAFHWAGPSAEIARGYSTLPPAIPELYFKEFHLLATLLPG